MALFEWTDEFSVQVKEIDDQHKILVDLINQLHEAMKLGKSKEILGDVFAELIRYTEYHFQWEERLMQKHAYPDYPRQKDQHQGLTKKVLELQQRHKEGKLGLSLETSTFLRNWLAHHIQGIDSELGAFLNAKGIR